MSEELYKKPQFGEPLLDYNNILSGILFYINNLRDINKNKGGKWFSFEEYYTYPKNHLPTVREYFSELFNHEMAARPEVVNSCLEKYHLKIERIDTIVQKLNDFIEKEETDEILFGQLVNELQRLMNGKYTYFMEEIYNPDLLKLS